MSSCRTKLLNQLGRWLDITSISRSHARFQLGDLRLSQVEWLVTIGRHDDNIRALW